MFDVIASPSAEGRGNLKNQKLKVKMTNKKTPYYAKVTLCHSFQQTSDGGYITYGRIHSKNSNRALLLKIAAEQQGADTSVS